MHIENCTAQSQKQMASTGKTIVGENMTVGFVDARLSLSGSRTVIETVKFHGETSKSSAVKSTIIDSTNQKQCNDVAKELSNLHLGGIPKTAAKAKNASHQKDTIRIEHQNNSETDDDDDKVASKNSKATENTNSAAQKTNKNKKPKSKKNKRKKSQSQQLTPEERASINKLMKNLITNEVRRSSLNKMMMSQQGCENGTRIHRTSQGESADSVNGLEETVEIDCRKARSILNGVGVHDCSDSVQSLTDNGESLPCSTYSDYHSEDSGSDSGKGGSDIQCTGEAYNGTDDCPFSYTFEVPQDLCGALIGKHGRLINGIQDQSNTKIFVREHVTFVTTKLCTIEGAQIGIKKALHLIRKRFPATFFGHLTLQQIIFQPEQIAVPEAMQLRLPEGVGCEVIVSSMLCPGQLFLQQPTHPTYPSLTNLVHLMTSWYSQVDAPGIKNPQEGNLCAVPGVNGWYRAKVINILSDSKECEVMFVDYGGYSRMPISLLRQIRCDFFTLPFQSQECYLANVQPIEGSNEWNAESVEIFEELATSAILQAFIVGYSVEGNVPLVHLFKTTNSFSTIFINRELVNRGVAEWVEYI